MKIKIKTYGKFILGNYKSYSEAKPLKEFCEEQIMNALNKSKSFKISDWSGNVNLVTFTITNIEKDEYDSYIYTIKSNKSINTDYCPSILQICRNCENVASPISYSIYDWTYQSSLLKINNNKTTIKQ